MQKDFLFLEEGGVYIGRGIGKHYGEKEQHLKKFQDKNYTSG